MNPHRDTTQKTPLSRLTILAGAFVLTCGLTCGPARAQTPASQTWLVCTRAAPRGAAPQAADRRIRFWQLEQNAWRLSDRATFHAAGPPEVPTVYLIHGNRSGPEDAIQIGDAFRRQLIGTRHNRPFRLVIWSWPSEQVCRGVRSDVQRKAHYSDIQSVYLAECLRETAAERPVTLVGYSFGARIITGALELTGGGQVGGYRLAEPAMPREAPWRAVLIAAALDAHWLSPGQRNGRAVGQLDRLLVTSNPADRVMRLYPRMYGRRGPEALGYTGSGYWLAAADHGKVRRLDVRCTAGSEHGWWSYWRSGSLRGAVTEYALGDP